MLHAFVEGYECIRAERDVIGAIYDDYDKEIYHLIDGTSFGGKFHPNQEAHARQVPAAARRYLRP